MTSALPDFIPELSALVAKLNQNMVKVETSKSLTLLERQLLAMLHREFFGARVYEDRIQHPDHVFGLVVSGGTSANITALWNARNRALLSLGFTKSHISEFGAFDSLRRAGYDGFAVIASRLAHYSIRKAVSLLGIGERNVLVVRQDSGQKTDLVDLEACIRASRERRLLVVAIIGIAGATETGTIDPLADMAAIAARHGIYFHVDAAWGGALVFSERHRGLLKGIEQADTITLCPHKQLYAPQGISLCLFKDSRSAHASSVQAVYQGQQGSFDMGQYTIEGSRPAMFLPLHAILHVISRKGIGALVEQGIDKTRYLAAVLARHHSFELIAEPEINILNYRYIPRRLRHKTRFSLEENRQISQAVAAIQKQQFMQGRTFVSKTDILHESHCSEPITVFRVVIANPVTTHQDLLDNLADQLEIAAACVEGDARGSSVDRSIGTRALQRELPDTDDQRSVPIGRAIDNTELLILDGAQRLLPVGATGEICISGDGLAAGYMSQGQVVGVSIPHPHKSGAKLIRTGDFGRRLPDGNVEFRGRRDRQVKVLGMRVELGEVEASLSRLQEVKECAVIATADADSTSATLVAFVVPHSQPEATGGRAEKSLRRRLVGTLPRYMVPDLVYIVEQLPLTPTGKVDRRRLESMQLRSVHAAHEESFTEARLREIWAQILEGRAIRATDDFFTVGGRLPAALEMRKRIKTTFAVELSLQSLFEHPRLDDIAGKIEESQADAL
jgi:putative pyridoxal-dependent aspartate 1-decarboxylase